MSVWGEARVLVEDERGDAEERRAAHDALFGLLGVGLLGLAAAPARRRKTLGLLAILAALAFFLWRRMLAASEPVLAATDDHQSGSRESELRDESHVAPLSPQVDDPIVEEAGVAEPVAEDTAVEDRATTEVADEVAAEPEPEPVEAEAFDTAAHENRDVELSHEFEALDAALAALIGELERVEAIRIEAAEGEAALVEEEQNGPPDAAEADANDTELQEAELQEAELQEAELQEAEPQEEAEQQDPEQQEAAQQEELAREREREKQAELAHAGRQLAHAGGYGRSGYGGEEGVHLPDDEGEAADAAEAEAEAEARAEAEAAEIEAAAVAYAEAWRSDPAPVQEAVAREDEVAPEPVAPAPAADGIVGLIGRYYSHRGPGGAPEAPPAQAPAAEPTPPPAVEPEPAAQAAPESDWL